MVISTLFETGIGIAAALVAVAQLRQVPGAKFPLPLAHGLATAGLLEHDLLDEPLIVEHGRMRTPDGPVAGRLGISVNRGAVARFTVELVEATA